MKKEYKIPFVNTELVTLIDGEDGVLILREDYLEFKSKNTHKCYMFYASYYMPYVLIISQNHKKTVRGGELFRKLNFLSLNFRLHL